MNFDEFFDIPMMMEQEQEASEQRFSVEDENEEEYEPPFNLEWVFGHDPTVKIINLTDRKKKVIGFASSNICGLYNLETKKCDYLLGHVNHINTISHDATGRFVVASDKACVSVWDRECEGSTSPELIRMLDTPHPNGNITNTSMSFDGKSIVTVDDHYILKFWFWSFGNTEADGEVHLRSNFGAVKTIKFSPNPTEFCWFCITTESHVKFINFDMVEKKLVKYNPTGLTKANAFNDSTYILNSRKVISITAAGYGLIWCDVLFEPSDEPITNKKNFNKAIQLGPGPLNIITSVDGSIAVGMQSGEIKFYDNDLKYLYFFQAIKFDPIQSVAFNLVERKFILTDRRSIAREKPILDDGTEVWYRPLLPRDATLNKAPFIIRDFFVATTTGKMEYINFTKKQSYPILYKTNHAITHFDLHPSKPWICLGNTYSQLFIYHIETKNILTEVTLPPIKLNETDKILTNSPISCLSYSHSSNHLFCGLANGSIWMLDPITLIPITASPLTFTFSQIDKIKFNDTSTYLAYTDMEFYLNILHYEGSVWHLVGRYREHTRNIIAVLWLEQDDKQPRLATIGEDRRLVEYDIALIYDTYKQSYEAGEEWIKSIPENIFKEYTLEQTPVILSAVFVPTNIFDDLKTSSKYILITCDTHFKYKIFDADTFQTLTTLVGPRYESPLHTIKYLQNKTNNFLVFASRKSIGLQYLPMDGNPYGRRGMVGSPFKIQTIRISFDNTYLLTLGEKEYSIQMWRINPRPIVETMKVERPYLEPFCNLLPGGKDGWLFKEIQDFFYYIQILSKGINTADDMEIVDTIPVTELVDFMRGIGYFPSDYTINHLMNEATRTFPGEPHIKQISFRKIFKLYINHRPINGYKIERIVRVLKALCINEYLNDPEIIPSNQEREDPNSIPWEDLFISKEEILSLLIEKGEKVQESQALLYLKELLLPNQILETTDPSSIANLNIYTMLPNKINMKSIVTSLLGMPMDDDFTPVFSKVNDPSEIKPELSNKLKMDDND